MPFPEKSATLGKDGVRPGKGPAPCLRHLNSEKGQVPEACAFADFHTNLHSGRKPNPVGVLCLCGKKQTCSVRACKGPKAFGALSGIFVPLRWFLLWLFPFCPYFSGGMLYGKRIAVCQPFDKIFWRTKNFGSAPVCHSGRGPHRRSGSQRRRENHPAEPPFRRAGPRRRGSAPDRGAGVFSPVPGQRPRSGPKSLAGNGHGKQSRIQRRGKDSVRAGRCGGGNAPALCRRAHRQPG